MNRNTTLILGLMLLGITSCYKKNAEDMYPPPTGSTCDTTNVTFKVNVKPVIDTKCATSGCHKGISPTGYDLSTYNGIAAVAKSKKLLSSITHDGATSAMPKGLPKLDDCTIAQIAKWINDGAPEN